MLTRRWRKKIGGYFLRLLGREEPPWEVALSFAVGVAISFSPFVGFHALMAILIAWVFRLNKVDVLIGTMVNNPWSMVPVYSSATILGWIILGHPREKLPEIPFDRIFAVDHWWGFLLPSHWMVVFGGLKPYLAALAVGSTIFSIAAGLATYLVLVRLIRRHREHKADRAIRRSERRALRAAERAREKAEPSDAEAPPAHASER